MNHHQLFNSQLVKRLKAFSQIKISLLLLQYDFWILYTTMRVRIKTHQVSWNIFMERLHFYFMERYWLVIGYRVSIIVMKLHNFLKTIILETTISLLLLSNKQIVVFACGFSTNQKVLISWLLQCACRNFLFSRYWTPNCVCEWVNFDRKSWKSN